MTAPTEPRPRIPRGVWVLGFVSLLMDVSSEMVHSLLPLFMLTTLGASAFSIGLVEGLAEATALIVKVFSGTLSDYLGKRKPLALLGYTMGALTKPLFAIAPGVGMVLTARLLDRTGKGLRGAPRDALVADLTPPAIRGAAFGLRQSLDTVGAFLGPLIAVGLMLLWANDFRAIFWVAVIPGLMAVALLIWGVKEPEPAAQAQAPAQAPAQAQAQAAADQPPAQRINPLTRHHLARLSPAYWRVVTIGAVFTLARFSEAFLVLRAQQSGLPLAAVPLVMVAMSAVYAVSAYPFGRLFDRHNHPQGHRNLLAGGLLVLIAADLVLAQNAAITSLPVLLTGVLLWGLHMGMTQGLLATLVAATAPADLRGTAFGFFNLVSGVALLIASALAGALWDQLGAGATFYAGAGMAGVAVVGVLLAKARHITTGTSSGQRPPE